MSDDEYERFEITDYDLECESNPNRGRRRTTKNQQIYGIWNDDSENEDAPESSFGRRRGGKAKPKDYTAPVSFVSSGIQQSGKKVTEEKDESDEDDDQRPSFSNKNYSSSEESEAEIEIKNVKSVAGLRQQARKAPMSKGVGDWEAHTRGIGAKLLLQMGYKPGKGLGKDLQGISAPIQASVRKGRGAIGAYGPETPATVGDPKLTKKVEDERSKEKSQQWRKDKTERQQKNRYHYKSVEDVIEKGKKPGYILDKNTTKSNQVTIIDMTGPEKRVLSGYHALAQSKIGDEDLYENRQAKQLTNFSLPELMHNLNIIVDMCEKDIITIDKQKCATIDQLESLEQEKENLLKITELEKEYIVTLSEASDLVERLVNPEDDYQLTLEEAEKIFIKLQTKYASEYIEFSLGDLAPGIVAPLINSKLQDWNLFTEPTKHIELIRKWRTILQMQNNNERNKIKSSNIFDPYSGLIWSGVIPVFRSAASTWNPRLHNPMIALLDSWAPLFPEWILDNVLEQLILSKITLAVSEWNPLTDTIPIHLWILPWVGLLGKKMNENVYPTIRDKLSKALRSWNPEDRSARAMLTPWKSVFADEDLQVFLIKNIVPKLELRLSEFVINPLQQDLEIFNQVWEWKDLITVAMMAQIMDKYLFPKWTQTLVIWLNQSPNYDQVSRWYMGWKGLFSEDVLKQTSIKEHFRRALELMQRATGATPIAIETPAAPSPPRISKPPSLLDLQIQPPAAIEFKELVSQKFAERGIIFAPMPGRREKGKQVYRAGKLFCYIERAVCIASSDGGVTWSPLALSVLLERAVNG